jgi:hypothetical protein
MKEEQDIELIELYIQNKLDKSERERVDERLKTENDFLELFKDVEILLKGVRSATRKELADELKGIENNIPPETKMVSINRTYWIGAAAAVTLIAVFFIWKALSVSPGEQLFAEYYEPYPNVLQSAVRGDNDISELADALQSYEEKDYKAAIEKLEAVEVKDFGVFFYLGSSYLAIKDGKKAVSNFEKCLQPQNRLSAQAEWYQALGYLVANDLGSSVQVLKSITSKQNSYSARAEEILTKLQEQ